MDVNGTELMGVKWQLRSITLETKTIDNVPEAGAHMIIGADGRASGRGGCNLFFAGYKLKDNILKFDSVASTKRYCEATMEVENAFFKAMRSVTKLTVGDDTLKIESKNGKTALTFVRAPQD